MAGVLFLYKWLINRNFEHTCRVSPAHEAHDTPGPGWWSSKVETHSEPQRCR